MSDVEPQDVEAGLVGEMPVGAEDPVTEEELVADEIERTAARAETPPSGRRVGPLRRLYRGETSFDFVGRRKLWLTISAIIILAGIVSLGVRGLNLGITFKGGEAWTVSAPGVSQVKALDAVEAAGLNGPTVQLLGRGTNEKVRVTADLNSLHASARATEETKVIDALAKVGHTAPNAVSATAVGPTWGGQVTQKAVIALIVFLVLVAVYISIRFEPKMAVAAFVALLHDLMVTAGVYSLFGFQVTPDTVIAVLTILGYSLYDTVVVFDRVRDNTKGLGAGGRMTYSEMVNLSMNQTLARSINTSLVAIMPVLSILLIGAELLGATTLLTYGLALFVGLMSGAYSSIFIASPILAVLKEREPRYVALRQRIEAKGERLGLLTPRAAAALVGASAASGSAAARGARSTTAATSAIRPGQSKRSPQPAPDAARAKTAGGEPGPNGAAAPRRPAAGGGRRPPQRARKGSKGKRRR
ncbi:MAG: protein translocase subunit SecF [Acidimicrobiales bacterium]